MAGDPTLYQIKHPIAEQFGDQRTAAETAGTTFTMTTPTPAPAPMTVERLKHIRENYQRLGEAALERHCGDLLARIDALTARVAELERERQYTCEQHRNEVRKGERCVWCELAAARGAFDLSESERQRLAGRINATEAELAAARKVEDGEVEEALGWLDKPQLYPSGRIKKIAALVRQLYAALKEAERENATLAAGQCVIGKGGLTNDDYGNQFCAMERRAQAAEAKLYAAMDALTFILPLAKGYAHEHPVGANQRHVDEAAETLRALQTKDTTE